MKFFVFSFLLLLTIQFSFAQVSTTPSVTTTATSPSLPWTATVKSELSSTIENAKKVGGGSTENQFRIAYKFSEAAQLGLLFGGKYKFVGQAQNQSDQEMVASDTAIAGILVAPSLLGSDKTIIDGRFYLPTSKDSIKLKQNLLARVDMILPYSLTGQKNLTFWVSPRFADFEFNSSKFDILSQVKLAQGSKIAPYIALNHKVKMGYKTGLNRTEEYMGPEVGIEALPHKLVKLGIYVNQERNILNPSAKNAPSDYSAFNSTESKYFVFGQIKL